MGLSQFYGVCVNTPSKQGDESVTTYLYSHGYQFNGVLSGECLLQEQPWGSGSNFRGILTSLKFPAVGVCDVEFQGLTISGPALLKVHLESVGKIQFQLSVDNAVIWESTGTEVLPGAKVVMKGTITPTI